MTLHKLMPEAAAAESTRPFAGGISLQHEDYSIAQAIVKSGAVRTFGEVATHFPIHRLVRCAVRGNMEDLFDDLALSMGLAPQRLHTGHLLLAGSGVFVEVSGSVKSGYCSVAAQIWADSRLRAEDTRAAMMRILGDRRVLESTFVIDWH